MLDDLPSMDDAPLRRGRASAHVVYGEAITILAAFGLLNLAFDHLARAYANDPPLARQLTALLADGVGLDGRLYHIDSLGDGGWVTANGATTSPASGWSAGAPYWRAGGYWRTRRGAVTFPLGGGGWSDGAGRRYVPLRDVTFAVGPSLPLHFYGSVAVDPGVIPLGSRVYVPAYRDDGHGGWFIAQDTGGAINGRHIDVYRPPPSSADDSGQYLTGERIFVIKPHK